MDRPAAETFILETLRTRLPKARTYHCLAHTLDVAQAAMSIAAQEGVTGHDLDILRTAALFHDSGFINQNLDHEEAGCAIAREHLPNFGYTPSEVEQVCMMIMATRIPQAPQDKLARILCDADLDYLGRPDFFSIGDTLFAELRSYGVLRNEREWDELQIRFIEGHHYFTPTNQRLREAKKQEHTALVRQRLARVA